MVNPVRAQEMQIKEHWLAEYILSDRPPFSFIYDGQSSNLLLANWPRQVETRSLDEARTQHILTWEGPGLQVRCTIVEYLDFPVVEWTVRIKNTRSTATGILEKVQGVDLVFRPVFTPASPLTLHHNQGDTCSPEAYQPFKHEIQKGQELSFSPIAGRPTSFAFPYFNLQYGAGGNILALGWPGQWAARFSLDGQGSLCIQGGQELTHLRLLEGEEIRTPLVAWLFYQGDVFYAQNLWRQWMFAHNLPRRNGQLPPPVSAMCAGLHQNETGEKAFIDLLTQNQAGVDYWWMDAGWYPGAPGPLGEWTQVGSWQPDPQRFPGGIKAVANYAHVRGMKLVLWFELERVSPGSAWREHPDWLLAVKPEERRTRLREDLGSWGFALEEAHRNQIREDDRLFNLGQPEARQFLTNYISDCIRQWGIDLFRLDFNISPLDFWRGADAPDRQGMTENKYVSGLLAFFDELLQRHPHLLIDTCASGGRRIDLETLRRAIVYTRSDYWTVSTTADQCQTHGIASWVPHTMCTSSYDDTYRFYSNLAPSLGISFDFNHPEQVDWRLFRQRVQTWRKVAPIFYGDYYPLMEWSKREEDWIAWQFNCPQAGDGLLQAFRRKDSSETAQILRLHGLDPQARYELADIEPENPAFGVRKMSGKELMENGLTVQIKSQPGAAAIRYQIENNNGSQSLGN